MFVPQGPINIKSVLVHVTVWRRTNRMFNICTRNNEFPDTNMQIETSMSYKLHVYPPLIALPPPPPPPASQWRHNERDGVSNHQPRDCLLNHLFKAQIKENIKAPRHWPLCGEFTGDRASNVQNVSIWWRHHGCYQFCRVSSSCTVDLTATPFFYFFFS